MSRLLECGVLLRLYTMFMSGLYAYTGLAEELSNTYRIAHADSFAYYTTVGLALFAILGLIDLTVNDLMPARFVIARALRDRHLVNMAISCCFAVLMWTCVKYDLPSAILPFYGVYAVFVPVAAFADVRKRFKNNKA